MKLVKIKIYSVLCITIAAIMLAPYIFEGVLFGFFSDFTKITTVLGTGSIRPVIDNLQLEANGVIKTEEEIEQSSNFIRINKSVIFSFTVRNNGANNISYSLNIEIVSDEGFKEAGKLLIYPYDVADDVIYQNLQKGDLSGAITGADVSDLATGELSSKNYQFKLFFYEDADIVLAPEIYHDKSIEINIALEAVLSGKETGWTGTEKKSFSVITVIDTVYPDIWEVSAPKTYFITKAQDIDLTSYATATDSYDGDITSNIVITSSPQFDPQKAGEYNITYNVTNSLGNPAAPLHITVVVWDFAKITSGYYHTLALTTHGKIYTWGYNYYGQLGDGTYTDKSVPTLLTSLDNIIDVAAGVGCSYALASDGQVYSWGRNENGRLGDNTTIGKNKPVKVAQPEGVKFVQISGRFATAGGVTAEGDVYIWGYGGYGAAGTNKTSDLYVPTKIGLSNIAQLELGYYNGAAVTKDGNIYTWGSNTYGALGTGAAASNGPNPIVAVPYFSDENIKMKQVSVGYYHMAAVSEDGRLFTWGYGAEGRLGNGATSNKFVPQPITMAAPVTKALAGYFHTGALTNNGTAYFFGQNVYGKHGSGNSTNHSTPYELTSVTNITDFSLAYDSSFVLSGRTEVYGMGYGGTGVLGTGNNSSSNTAVKWAFIPPEPH